MIFRKKVALGTPKQLNRFTFLNFLLRISILQPKEVQRLKWIFLRLGQVRRVSTSSFPHLYTLSSCGPTPQCKCNLKWLAPWSVGPHLSQEGCRGSASCGLCWEVLWPVFWIRIPKLLPCLDVLDLSIINWICLGTCLVISMLFSWPHISSSLPQALSFHFTRSRSLASEPQPMVEVLCICLRISSCSI